MVSTPATSPPPVFVDSSVLFAAALSASGSARDLIVQATHGRIALFVSLLVWQETQRNLAAKAPRGLPFFQAVQAAAMAQVVNPPTSLVQRVARVVAVKDAPIVAGAITAKATYLATYDRKHLLRQASVIQAHFGITATTPDAILAAI